MEIIDLTVNLWQNKKNTKLYFVGSELMTISLLSEVGDSFVGNVFPYISLEDKDSGVIYLREAHDFEGFVMVNPMVNSNKIAFDFKITQSVKIKLKGKWFNVNWKTSTILNVIDR